MPTPNGPVQDINDIIHPISDMPVGSIPKPAFDEMSWSPQEEQGWKNI